MDLSNSPEEIVQVKLAERLHNMRTIDYIDEAKKKGGGNGRDFHAVGKGNEQCETRG